MSRVLTCGVIVTDGRHILIGHATRSPRWDIPKGVAESGEAAEAAARRELTEETGLHAPATLQALGQFDYMPSKDLALFAWRIEEMPDPSQLVCHSTFLIDGELFPEFDRFSCPTWPEALPKLGKAMAVVLTGLMRSNGWGSP